MKSPQWSVRWPFVILGMLIIFLSVIYLAQIKLINYEAAVGIIVATTVAIVGWFIASLLNTRLEVEARVHQEVIASITNYSDALTNLRSALTYSQLPAGELWIKYHAKPNEMWSRHALNFHHKVGEATIEVLNAQKKFRDTIEANELVVHKLQDMYRFLMLHNDGILEEISKVSGSALTDMAKTSTKEDYDRIIDRHSIVSELIWDQQGFCTDFKYALNNLIYSKLFFVKMPQRVTSDGSKTLYDLDLKSEIKKYTENSLRQSGKKKYAAIMNSNRT